MSKNITCLYCIVSVVVKMLPAPVYGCRGVLRVRSCARDMVTGAVLPSFPM